jgi:hypothetical protein
MAHGFPPPFCTGKKFIQDENGKIVCPSFFMRYHRVWFATRTTLLKTM